MLFLLGRRASEFCDAEPADAERVKRGDILRVVVPFVGGQVVRDLIELIDEALDQGDEFGLVRGIALMDLVVHDDT